MSNKFLFELWICDETLWVEGTLVAITCKMWLPALLAHTHAHTHINKTHPSASGTTNDIEQQSRKTNSRRIRYGHNKHNNKQLGNKTTVELRLFFVYRICSGVAMSLPAGAAASFSFTSNALNNQNREWTSTTTIQCKNTNKNKNKMKNNRNNNTLTIVARWNEPTSVRLPTPNSSVRLFVLLACLFVSVFWVCVLRVFVFLLFTMLDMLTINCIIDFFTYNNTQHTDNKPARKEQHKHWDRLRSQANWLRW